MIMTREMKFGKVQKLVTALLKSVERSRRKGERVDVVERHLLEETLRICLELLTEYVTSAGDGDEGEIVEHDGQTLVRLADPKQRPVTSRFSAESIANVMCTLRERNRKSNGLLPFAVWRRLADTVENWTGFYTSMPSSNAHTACSTASVVFPEACERHGHCYSSCFLDES